MKRAQEGDIVRIKGANRHELYEVIGAERRPKGLLIIAAGSYRLNIDNDKLIIVTRRGNRYDYNIDGSFAE